MNTKQIFINLAVKDLNKTMEFFGQLGFTFNPQFTDEKAACMVINDFGFVMLLKEEFFKTFIKKELADAHKTTEALVGFSAESRNKVDEIMEKALSIGAVESREKEDYGFMYGRSFNDLDGHIWEVFWMDPNNVNK